MIKTLSLRACSVALAALMASPATAQTLPTQLNIVVVSGDGAVDAPGRQSTTPHMVRVEDENHKPVANAVVEFTLPTEGATGEFGNRSKTITVTTDPGGIAVAKGLRTNHVAGKVPIHINASYRGLMASASMLQFNVVGAPGERGGGHGKVAALLLVLAGARGAGPSWPCPTKKLPPPAPPRPPPSATIPEPATSARLTKKFS